MRTLMRRLTEQGRLQKHKIFINYNKASFDFSYSYDIMSTDIADLC